MLLMMSVCAEVLHQIVQISILLLCSALQAKGKAKGKSKAQVNSQAKGKAKAKAQERPQGLAAQAKQPRVKTSDVFVANDGAKWVVVETRREGGKKEGEWHKSWACESPETMKTKYFRTKKEAMQNGFKDTASEPKKEEDEAAGKA
jgi:hypothetical protein